MFISRRSFLKTGALLGAVAAAPGGLSRFSPLPRHVAVQLYSVRDDMKNDPKTTIEAVAKMGFKEVEGYGYRDGKIFGMSMPEFGKLLKANGLSMPSSHVNMKLEDYDFVGKTPSDHVKKAIDEAAALGQKYVICPFIEATERSSIDKLVVLYQAAADYAQKAGVRFGYHNHDFEFTQRGPDGRLMIEWILHEVDPDIMAMEMDIYWVCFAKHNALDWFRLYPGRWKLCHAKDLAKTEKRETVEVGDGEIDFRGIFAQKSLAGMQHFVVELEHYRTTPLQGIEKARKNLVKILS